MKYIEGKSSSKWQAETLKNALISSQNWPFRSNFEPKTIADLPELQKSSINPQIAKASPEGGAFAYRRSPTSYNVDSISNPQASRSASGIYLEFLFLRAHSRRRVDRMYWSGLSLNSFTICSKEVTVGTTGPMGSGLPQFGFPRRFAIDLVSLRGLICACFLATDSGAPVASEETTASYFTYFFFKNQ